MRLAFIISLLLIITSSVGVHAQEFAFELWHDGKVVLENGDTLTGNVKYDMHTDLVQVQVGDRFESYSARKLLFLEIFDKTVKRYRRMYSLPYNTSGEYRAPVFLNYWRKVRSPCCAGRQWSTEPIPQCITIIITQSLP